MEKKTPDLKNSRQTFIYKLLTDPHYRIGRHVIFIFAVGAIVCDQVFNTFLEYPFRNELYQVVAVLLAVFLAVGYFNLYVLVPRYLLKKKYGKYILSFQLLMVFFLLAEFGIEYYMHIYFGLDPGLRAYISSANILPLDMLSTFFMNNICFGGSAVTLVLKDWLIHNQRMNELENEQVKAEVAQLKEQVNPSFLFTVLNRIGVLTQSNPPLASDMLMELSELLRYQLYDCSREKVLLAAEVRFLSNYLNLEKLHAANMEFAIKAGENTGRVLVPPLLFIPFVQLSVREWLNREEKFVVQIEFESAQDFILFSCSCPDSGFVQNPGLDKIKRRLDRLFESRYTLQIMPAKENINPAICLQIFM